jgi:hypothetical protein
MFIQTLIYTLIASNLDLEKLLSQVNVCHMTPKWRPIESLYLGNANKLAKVWNKLVS